MMVRKVMKKTAAVTAALALLVSGPASAADIDKVVETETRTQQAAKSSQKKVDRTSGQTDKLLMAYREALWKRKQLTVYAKQLGELTASQEADKASLETQIGEVDRTGEEIMPLMLRMVDTLEEFIKLDVPFLPEERAERLAKLRTVLSEADTSVAEKYRRVLEAYQIEADYGRTLETYRGELKFGEAIRAVDFLRVGRVGLYYSSLDGKLLGQWDNATRKWRGLDSEYRQPVRRGIQLAKDQIAPELLNLPVAAPTKAAAKAGGAR